MSKNYLQKFKRSARLFQRVQAKLLAKHKGQIIAIEPDSGKYFVGRDELEAAKVALTAFPNKVFNFFRIGYPAVHKFRRCTFHARRIR